MTASTLACSQAASHVYKRTVHAPTQAIGNAIETSWGGFGQQPMLGELVVYPKSKFGWQLGKSHMTAVNRACTH